MQNSLDVIQANKDRFAGAAYEKFYNFADFAWISGEKRVNIGGKKVLKLSIL